MPQIAPATADSLDSLDCQIAQARAIVRLMLNSPEGVDPETLAGVLHCLDRLLCDMSGAMHQIQRDPTLAGEPAPNVCALDMARRTLRKAHG